MMFSMYYLNIRAPNHPFTRNVAVTARQVHLLWSRRTRGVLACPARGQSVDGADDDDDGDAPVAAGRPLRVERLLANLGYGKRRECQMLVKKGHVTTRDGGKLKVGDKVCWGDVVLDGEELDPPSPVLVVLNKPTGYVVTSPDDENIPDPVVYDLLPYRFGRRRPFLSCVGRLDKDTSGLLLLTDDGALLHRINSPKCGIRKVYEATLAEPLPPRQAEAAARKFASGALVLEGDYTPLLPAKLEVTGERTARVAICEGRYHQVRRMFAAVGSKVVALRRISVGGLSLGSLAEGEWRYLTPQELDMVFGGPSAEGIRAGPGSYAIAPDGPFSAEKLRTGSGDETSAGAPGVGNSSGAGEASDRSGSLGANSNGEGKGGDGGERLTKKEKKKGRKAGGRKEQRAQLGSGVAGVEDGEEDEMDEDGEDVELLADDDETDIAGDNVGREGGTGSGRRSRRNRRPMTVRQGTVQDRRDERIGELLAPGLSYDEDDAAAGVVLSAGAGTGVRKYRDGAKWRRRREALRQLLPP